jgi:hypothetical protein
MPVLIVRHRSSVGLVPLSLVLLSRGRRPFVHLKAVNQKRVPSSKKCYQRNDALRG